MINSEINILGHNEDAIAFQLNPEEIMVVNIDGWVASSDRPTGMTGFQVGYRAVANAISDVIVKGANPEGMIISTSISKEYRSELKEIIGGFRQASIDFQTPYLGGDMNSSKDLVIDVTVWGRTNKLNYRSGATVGDKVYWLGPSLGSTAASLGILIKGWFGDKERASEVMGKPSLFPQFVNIQVNSATDSSDGLAKSLYHISKLSGVRINLYDLKSIETESWIKQVSEENGILLTDLFLYGGEELGVVFTSNSIENLPEKILEIGRVVKGSNVYMDNELVENRGWDHFSQ